MLLPSRERAFEIRHPFHVLGEWFAQSFVLACQSCNLVRLAILGRLSSLIVIASALRPHVTLMADSRTKYKHGILDQENFLLHAPVP